MAEMTTKEKKSFADRLDGLKAEFGKIFWPDGKMVFRQSTAAVVIISAVMCGFIRLIDVIAQFIIGTVSSIF